MTSFVTTYNTIYVYRNNPFHDIAGPKDLITTIGTGLYGISAKTIEFMVPITFEDLPWVNEHLFTRLIGKPNGR